MKIDNKKFICFFICVMVIATTLSYAGEITYDKQGHEVTEVYSPTTEATDYETMTQDALRNVGFNSDRDVAIAKNIISDETMYVSITETSPTIDEYGYTIIRHTSSIATIDEGKYEVIEDRPSGRIKLRIQVPDAGQYYAKNGFYRVNGKIYYFDDNELMVLGPARDTEGLKFFFSYETGEMIEGQ